MRYQLLTPKIIHWDEYFHLFKPGAGIVIRNNIIVDLFAVTNDGLPIVIEAHNEVIGKGNIILNCIIHTKAFLLFEKTENPINDIVKMLEESSRIEQAVFQIRALGTPTAGVTIDPKNNLHEMRFNKAYLVKQYAMKIGLLNAQVKGL
jgi:hypothetical protein